jgi:predicted secreted protein
LILVAAPAHGTAGRQTLGFSQDDAMFQVAIDEFVAKVVDGMTDPGNEAGAGRS